MFYSDVKDRTDLCNIACCGGSCDNGEVASCGGDYGRTSVYSYVKAPVTIGLSATLQNEIGRNVIILYDNTVTGPPNVTPPPPTTTTISTTTGDGTGTTTTTTTTPTPAPTTTTTTTTSTQSIFGVTTQKPYEELKIYNSETSENDDKVMSI